MCIVLELGPKSSELAVTGPFFGEGDLRGLYILI
jgi:hypothetical protein